VTLHAAPVHVRLGAGGGFDSPGLHCKSSQQSLTHTSQYMNAFAAGAGASTVTYSDPVTQSLQLMHATIENWKLAVGINTHRLRLPLAFELFYRPSAAGHDIAHLGIHLLSADRTQRLAR